jgi:hypothetical protein
MPGIVSMYEIDRMRNECNAHIDRKRMLEKDHGPSCPFYQKTVQAIADLVDKINMSLAQYHYQTPVTLEKVKEFFPHLDVSRLPEGYLEEQIKFADENDKRRNSFYESLTSITRGGTDTASVLFKDFAPHSFEFRNSVFNGGMIFHPAGSGSGAEAPILSVTLNDERDIWQVHT